MNDRNLIKAWEAWISESIKDRNMRSYFITFQCRNMNCSDQLIMERMHKEMETFYGRLLVRAAKSRSLRRKHPPRMFGAFDRPVNKKAVKQSATWLVNDGLHGHAMALMPVEGTFEGLLKKHIDERLNEYLRYMPYLISIDVLPIRETPERISNYFLKSIYRNRFSIDTVFVFPYSSADATKVDYIRRIQSPCYCK